MTASCSRENKGASTSAPAPQSVRAISAVAADVSLEIVAIADKKFDYTNYSFKTITESTVKRALQVIRMTGGKVTDAEVTIPPQESKAWKMEQ